jgi:ABC-2 type transport system ATP-binding protein
MSIRVESLIKSFGNQRAVDDISFSVAKGEVVGFLGPNGSGKSTTMRCICGIIPPDSGSVSIAGIEITDDILAIKRLIGYLPEHNPLPNDLYVKEYLHHIDGFYNNSRNRNSRVKNIIELTGLGREQHKKIDQLSKGFKQRVGLAQAIIHDPDVLILDEPTSGLDPIQIIEIRNLISGLSGNKTVLLSTHILQEVEAICTKVLVLKQGKLVADGTAASLKRDSQEHKQTIYIELGSVAGTDLFRQIDHIERIRQISEKEFLLEGVADKDLRETIFQFAVKNNIILLTIQVKEETLEEAFRKLTQQN